MRASFCLPVAAAVVFGLSAIPSAVAADAKAVELKENPQYTYWAKFKAGSTTTMTGELEAAGQKVTMEVTVTLSAVEKDKVTLDQQVSMVMNGQTMKQEPKKEVVTPAPKAGETYKEVGEEEVMVAGKALKCKIYESEKEEGGVKATMRTWVSDQVPGGAVKMTMKSAQMNGTFTAKSYEAK